MTRAVRVAHVTTIDVTLRFLLLPQMQRLRDEGFEVTAISAPGPWTSQLEAQGVRHIPWRNAIRSWSPRADARAFTELARILRRERFDLVHTHNPKPGIMGRVAARLAGVPCVVNTVHGLYVTPDTPWGKRVPVLALERLAARCSALEFYQSSEDLRWARRLRLCRPGQAVELGNGTDVERFDPAAVSPERRAALREELGLPAGSLVVGTVGRLVQEKGFRELLAVARAAGASTPGVRFLWVGDVDPEKADSVSTEELAEARHHILVTGWREDVRDLLAVMDVFVLASRREGLPRSAIEAAAMGRPLVLTDIRGCREVARDGEEALFVPPGDPGRLAAAVTRLVRDPELRESLGRAARARAVARFDERMVTERIVAGYHQVLASVGKLPLGLDGDGEARRAPVHHHP